MSASSRVEEFEANRHRLTGLAYRMTGSQHEADDIVQETYLRWNDADRMAIRSAESWLATVATRLSLDHLKSAKVKRETYVGPWLPEPLVPDASNPEQEVELDDSVTIALLLLLDKLSPGERAAYILHDLFNFGFDEIATMLGRSNDAVRKLASRARGRIDQDRVRETLTRDKHEAIVEAFFDAVKHGELSSLVGLLTDNVTMHTDGGGKVRAARKVLQGFEAVTHFLLNVVGPAITNPDEVSELALGQWFNGAPGGLFSVEGHAASAFNFLIVDGAIRAIHVQRNPDKLTRFRAVPQIEASQERDRTSD